ncbi:Disease resistance protein RGA2 [Rhynchospora pubera]|uniref:Disease resistance protein RGA2 n=1 Tax=Rhynchospora pubera TaxID=906938 RepID=A0AAV8FDN5_9POAL|nr:Disease resistance protein RGA2 [Rhynchospora pubera]
MVTGLGEILASAVVKELFSKLSSPLWEQLSLLWHFEHDLWEMKKTLLLLQTVLKDAEQKSFKDVSVCEWLKQLKFAAYDIEDLMCDCETSVPVKRDRFEKVRRLFTSSNPVIKNPIIANKMKKKRAKLVKIADKHKQFSFSGNPILGERDVIKERETFSKLDANHKTNIVGRESDTEEVMKLLLQEFGGNNISIIPITGLAGVGKTTLARLVFNDERVTRVFDLCVWVYVSMQFDLKVIGEKILSEAEMGGKKILSEAEMGGKKILSEAEMGDTKILSQAVVGGKQYHNLQEVTRLLAEVLCEKRYLIVLDDLWNVEGQHWDELEVMLQGGKSGSRIIVTARNENVTSFMADCLRPHRLQVLSDTDCWKVFSQKAFRHSGTGSSQLIDIGMEISRKCKGVPLAAESLGYIMCGKESVPLWEEVRDSDFWNLKGDNVLPSLKLSYYHLPSPLKLCFAYCAVFPKGEVIDKSKLIQEWIGLGFIHGQNENSNLESIGEEYVKELLGMSFFHVSEKHGKAKRELYMHHLVHDLASSVAQDEVCTLDAEKLSKAVAKNTVCRYALLCNYDDKLKNKIALPKKIRALHFKDCSSIKLPSKLFSGTKHLRAINLSQCNTTEIPRLNHLKFLQYLETSPQIQELPKSINNLYSLRAINLSNSRLKELPLPTSLSKLHYLNLSGCSQFQSFPESINALHYLEYLNLSNCKNLTQLPASLFSNHGRLQVLDLSSNVRIQNLPESLGALVNLESLNLSSCCDLQMLPSSIGRLCKLQILDLSWCDGLHEIPESLGDLTNLKELKLYGCCSLGALPASFYKLGCLHVLDLAFCTKLVMLPELIGNLKNLEDLNLSGCMIRELPTSIGNIKRLRMLNLSNCKMLKKIPSCVNNPGLTLLTEGCPSRRVFRRQIQHNSLTDAEASTSASNNISYLNSTSASNNIAYLDSTSTSNNISHLEYQYPKPDELEITCLDVADIECVDRFKLHTKSEVRSLALYWSNYPCRLEADAVRDKVVLEKLLPHPNLKIFILDGYMAPSYPTWAMDTVFPNITQLTLRNLMSCDYLPPLWHLPNLIVLQISNMPRLKKVSMAVSADTQAFKQLSDLLLVDLPNLEEWSAALPGQNMASPPASDFEELIFPSLCNLIVERCPNLRFSPFIPKSMCYSIKESAGLLSFEGHIMGTSSTPVSVLQIKDCKLPPEEWIGLRHLTIVGDLVIDSCEKLHSLPESIRGLTYIKCLEIRDCNGLVTLPEWLADLRNLRMLYIYRCRNLYTLPERLQHHKSFNTLRVLKCGQDLVDRYAGRDKSKIDQIPRVYIAEHEGSELHWCRAEPRREQ